MKIYLSSFYSLGCTKKGEEAINKFGLPPFIDGSCRREPDFENNFPAITGLCRPGFAEKLKTGDIVIYTTNKKRIGSRRIVAVLEVINDSCKNHVDASDWYKDQNLPIPNNLMVKETKYFELDKTHQMGKWGEWGMKNSDIIAWDNDYKRRAADRPKVAICKIIFCELNNPIELKEEEMKRIFNRRPGTRNPSIVKQEEWEGLKKIIK